MTEIEKRVVTLDGRGRVNLGPECANKRYLAHQERDGTIVLQPVLRIVRHAEWES